MLRRSSIFAAALTLGLSLLVSTFPASASDSVTSSSAQETRKAAGPSAPKIRPEAHGPRADLRRARLHHQNMRGANLHHARLHHANLRHAVLHSANLRRTKMNNAKLHHADLRHSHLHHTIAHRAILQDAKLQHATLHHAQFHRAELHRSNFTKAAMHHAQFTGATMYRATFHKVSAHHAVFEGVKARRAHFNRSTLRHATMTGGDFTKASFRHADLRNADFSRKGSKQSSAASTTPPCGAACTGANLTSSDFSGANLRGANFSGADLSGASLRNADLTGADLTGADLRNADFTGATLTNAIFRGAVTIGTIWGQQSPPSTSTKLNFCTSDHVGRTLGSGAPRNQATAVDGGLVLASYSRMDSNGSGTAVVEGPGGVLLKATFTCDLQNGSRVGAGDWKYPYTITLTGSTTGTHTSPLTGLTVDTSTFQGTITRDINMQVSWSVSANMTYAIADITVQGKYRATSSHEWEIDVESGSGSFTTAEGTYTGTSFNGSLVYADSAISGEIQMKASGSHDWLSALPNTWSKSIVLDIVYRSSGSSIVAMPSLSLTGTSVSGNNVSSITLNAQIPGGSPDAWTTRDLRFDATGTLYLRGVAADVTGWYQSGDSPQWELDAAVDDVPLRGHASIEAGTISMVSGTPGFNGTVEVLVSKTSSFVFDAAMAYTDNGNWTLTATGGGTTSWTPVAGLSIPASAFSGTITSNNGNLDWQIAIGSQAAPITWTGLARNVSLQAWYTLSPGCEALDCDATKGPYLSSHNGRLTFPSPSMTVDTSGAIRSDGAWAVFNASTSGQQTFKGPEGASLTLGSPSLTLWKGDAPHDTVPGLIMPNVNKSGAGLGVQFCGTFAASSVPYIGSTKAAPGCVSWAPAGIVVGMLGLGASTPGGSASANDPHSSVSGVNIGATTFDGLAWSSLFSNPTVTIGNTALTLSKDQTSISGSVTLPGELMKALGKPSTALVLPATATFSDPSWTAEDASFQMLATLPLDYSSNGFILNDLTVSVDKSGPAWSFGIEVDAQYKTNHTWAPVTMDLGYQDQELALELVATGTGANNDACACNGIDGEFQTPENYRYLTDSFMGVPGMHLWSITGQLIVAKGEPGFGIGATVYQDPTQMSQIMQGSTWMRGKFYVNADLLEPCLDFGFSSSDPDTYLQVKGGVLQTSDFSISVAPAEGCTVGSDQIPGGLAVNFNAAFSTAGYFDFSLAFDPAAMTFYESVDIGDVTLGGIDFTDGSLLIDITPSSQEVDFATDFTLPPSGAFTSTFSLRINSASHMQMDGAVSMTDWDMAGGTFDVEDLSFQMSFDTDAGTFSSSANGHMKFSAKSKIAFTADISYSNNALQQFDFDFQYTHGGIGYDYELDYDASAHTLSGGIALDYIKSTSHRFTAGGHNYERHAYMTVSLDYTMNTQNPSQATLTIAFSGRSSDGDLSVSGGATLSTTPGVDDSAWAKLHVHIPNMGSWDDSWTW